MQKNVTISIDEDINELWTKLAKKHDISKSRMIEDFLKGVLPILNESTPNKMMAKAMKQMAKEIDTTATLFDTISAETAMAFDDDVESYKEMKRG